MTGTFSPAEAAPLQLPGMSEAAEPFTRPDELLIFAGVPYARTYPWYSIDAHGYRTPPFTERKPPGTLRVIATGDSTTFGIGVLDHQPWAAVLRVALAGLCQGERRSEVINAGIVGYSTLQNRLQVQRDLLPLEPDLVVLLVSGANDATRVEGPGDAELSASQRSFGRRLARLRVARLFGLGGQAWAARPRNARYDSPTGRARVPPDEVEQNLRALDQMLPGRLVLGLFLPLPSFRETGAISAIAERVEAVAAERGLPLADVRPAIDALLPFPIYDDTVHPSPLGHTIIARTVLATLVPVLGLSPARTAWGEAWFAALDGDLAERAPVLLGPGAPPRFAELAALYRQTPNLDARIAANDPALPAALRTWDPLLGRRCRALSRSRLLPADAEPARQQEIASFVRPPDPLLACFEDERAFLAADDALRNLGRALIVFGAELGLVPVRTDVRRGQAALADDPADAVLLLEAVLALDPSDERTRLDLALRLRRLGLTEQEHAEYRTLAAGTGAWAHLALGLLAFDEGDPATAEDALRRAILGAPANGWAHYVLGQLLLGQDRLDGATRELATASGMLGAQAGWPALQARIEERRRELSAEAGH